MKIRKITQTDINCEYCGKDYCMERSDAESWRRFCSEECDREYKEQESGVVNE